MKFKCHKCGPDFIVRDFDFYKESEFFLKCSNCDFCWLDVRPENMQSDFENQVSELIYHVERALSDFGENKTRIERSLIMIEKIIGEINETRRPSRI